jgi:acyl carrier protein
MTDLAHLEAYGFDELTVGGPTTGVVRPGAAADKVADADATLEIVQAVLGEVLATTSGVIDGPVGPDNLLVHIGVSSVAMLQIHSLLEESLGAEIPTSALFDHSTVGELAAYLTDLR